MTMPEHPKIYHILHEDKLPSIISDGYLWSYTNMTGRLNVGTEIGMDDIKRRRRCRSVDCHKNTCVANYVPFYFCPRSVMLYVMFRQNHPGLEYKGGQGPIIHLEADLHETINWADRVQRRWAFSSHNATAGYAEFWANRNDLSKLQWSAINARNWGYRMPSNLPQESTVRSYKQAEFLVYGSFPWCLVRKIGVKSPQVRESVLDAVMVGNHQPSVEIMPNWYY